MQGFHGVTPETETTSHYSCSMATNPTTDAQAIKDKGVEQTKFTFDEDKVVIESQYANMLRFAGQPRVNIHANVGANRARRIIESLRNTNA